MAEFRVLADMRFWPTSGLGKVEAAILSRKPKTADVERLKVPGKYGHPLSTYRIAKALRAQQTANTVFWSAGFVPPLHSSVPVVVTVHDLTHLHYYDAKRRAYFNYIFRPLYKRCSAIICVSEHTRHELLAWSKASESKVHVVHNGLDSTYLQNRAKANLGYKYVLYAGNHRPYKNLGTLIGAYARSSLSQHGVHLALTGSADEDLVALARQSGNESFVHFLGHVPEQEMPALYRGAEVVAYVSLYEGFGLPILEAMASEVPVVTSNISSMPEVAGGAALIVDPLATDAVAEALENAAFNVQLRANLIQKGLHRCQTFSWDESARQVWQLLQNIALQ